jgi:hypothetical protein
MPNSNISNDYTITNYSASVGENRVRDPENDTVSAAASTLYQVDQTMASMVDGETITFQDTVGLQKTYIFDDDGDGATGTLDGSGRVRVQITSGGDSAALELKTAIESSNGHNGSIVVTDLGGSNPRIFKIQQSTAGAGGNTSITGSAIDNFIMTVASGSAFGGGQNETLAFKNANVIPYRLSIGGPFNIRAQATTSRYKVFLGEEKS